MALSTVKLSEFPLRNSLTFTSYSPSLNFIFFYSPKSSFRLLKPFCSLRTTENNSNSRYSKSPKTTYPWQEDGQQNPSKTPKPKVSSWINKWPSANPPIEPPPDPKVGEFNGSDDRTESSKYMDNKDRGQSAIQRIVLRLRNLGLGSEDDEEDEELNGADVMSVSGEEKLGDLLRRDWVRPDDALYEDHDDAMVLPWEREDYQIAEKNEDGNGTVKRRVAKAPTLAELTIEDGELRRLRRMGMTLRERINVAKAGVTQAVVEKIHDTWRKQELVRLKFHESLAHDMKTAHELVERRTGGLIIWRAGSVMVVYRGSNYEGPPKPRPVNRDGDTIFVPDVSSANKIKAEDTNDINSNLEKIKPAAVNIDRIECMTEEEAEYNKLLDGLGPRFVDWWGTGVLPVDADLLPQTVPGYKTPFRILPTGMRSRLTNAELTNLRKLAKSLPCHFALGRNRHHQGLAAAVIKLWEKSLVAKIAVKRGIQNTNNKLMAEEIKNLTGGVLLLRNKYYIVIYRGKDFLPTSVAAALAERQEMTKQIQDVEEQVRTATTCAARQEMTEQIQDVEEQVQTATTRAAPSSVDEGQALAGTLAEFYEAQARWGREISAEEHERMIEEASRAKSARVVKRIEHKLSLAQAKKLRAEKLLSKIEASMVPVGPCDDQETITDEERFMFRRVGLRMKAYLPLGIRGVFDGVIENMHLHWKHRELVKLISKQKNLAFVEETARLLEYESGGILVAIEQVPKGFAIIYYRGKNYRRPISLRPRNLLTKAKALKRSVAMQRHEALSQHISELENTIDQMKLEVGDSEDIENVVDQWNMENPGQFNGASELSQSEDEDELMDTDGDDDMDEEDFYSEEDEESDISRLKEGKQFSSKDG